ncbi:glucan synthase like 7, partial [Chrysochromulina tobinii]
MSASPPPLTGGEGERGREGVSATPPPPTPAADARLAHSSTASASRPSTAAGGNARSGVAFRASLFQGHPISMSHLAEHLSRCTRVDRRTRTRLTGATGGSGSLRVSSCVRAVGRASGFKFSSKLGGGGDDEGEGGAQPEGSHSAAQMAIGHARATSTMRSLLNTAPRLTEQQAQSIRESSCMPSDADTGAIHARFQDMADALPLIAEVLQLVGDVFRGGELSRNAAADLAKGSYAHEYVQEEVEVYSELRRLVRLDLFSDAQTVVNALNALKEDDAVTTLEALVRCLTTPNPGGEPVNDEAKRQLIFFSNSLHNARMSQPPPIEKMKSFTAFTPYYAEDVIYTEADLYCKAAGGKGEATKEDEATLLDLLQALFPDEWENFKERQEMGEAGLRSGAFGSDFVESLRGWASDRAQVLSRTVRGVQRYGDGLRCLARLEDISEEEIEWLVATKFEYVVACQIYGKQRRSQNQADVDKADAIDKLRRTYAANLRIAFVDDPEAEGARNPHFSSVLLAIEPESQRDLVLYKVRLPGNPIIGEGKPENQNHAVIFAHGEYLQTLDMNQDNYLGESLKMRNLLELFTGDVRLVGFPEHVFSVSGGAVAHFSGSNEFVFGTTVQRFLTWPLMVRFHYGHPDVWDKLWAISSGGVAKASRTLHVSEDIFGGFNVVMRGGTIDYAEFIHVGKGRDMSFIAVSGFESKISCGAAVTSASRDILRLMRAFDIFRLFSFYASMVGFYVTTLQSMWSVYLLALCQLLLAVMGMDVYDHFEYAAIGGSDACAEAAAAAREPSVAGRMRRQLEGGLTVVEHTYDFNQAGPSARVVDNFDWAEFISFHDFRSTSAAGGGSGLGGYIGAEASAADGLYDDSTVGEEPTKIITARYAMSTYNTAM